MERYLCIHGHFYQPERRNPWLNFIELQEDAFPFHDWNEKIDAECYTANASSHILNSNKKLIDVINNYSKISFNFGPTLISWLKQNNPRTYNAIIEADKISRDFFSGHGSAIAQVYNHIIMPLANKFEKYIQLKWAILDFQSNFKRKPEGMWLSETAVDLETLEMLAELEIKYVILSPSQALMVRKINKAPINENEWKNVKDIGLDTRIPYLCNLSSRRKINVFFYDNVLSNQISFGNLLESGENFAKTILDIPFSERKIPEIIVIATDGETFGHHHKFGDMALAYFLKIIESQKDLKLTVFGEYLEKYPPTYEVKIIENTSWSCCHGVERWRSDCGCTTGVPIHKDWNQKWRKPLRDAVNYLSKNTTNIFITEINKYIRPEYKEKLFAPLEEYILLLNSKNSYSVQKFIKKFFIYHKFNKSSNKELVAKIFKLCEMYRHSMLAQSSDAWFFDDISRIEAIQSLIHSARTIELAEKNFGRKIEAEFTSILENAISNSSKFKNGKYIYETIVKKSIYDFKKICAHLVLELLFLEEELEVNNDNAKKVRPFLIKINKKIKQKNFYNFSFKNLIYRIIENQSIRIILGRTEVFNENTYDEETIFFAAYKIKILDTKINTGNDNNYRSIYNNSFSAFIIEEKNIKLKNLKSLTKEIKNFLKNNKINKLIEFLNLQFKDNAYFFEDLTKDKQVEIIESLFTKKIDEFKHDILNIYNNLSYLFRSFLKNKKIKEQNPLYNTLPKYLKNIVGGNLLDIYAFLNKLLLYITLKELDIQKPDSEKKDAKSTEEILEKAVKFLNKILKETIKLKILGHENIGGYGEYIFSGKEILNIITTKIISQLALLFEEQPENLSLLQNIFKFIILLKKLKITPNLWNAQNIFFNIKRKNYNIVIKENNSDSKLWLKYFNKMLKELGIEVKHEN